jgi:diguanylate cyclase (GGDEF)-like protein
MKTRVLVVDDEPINRRLLTRTLEDVGYNVICANEGRSALKLLEKSIPDLILLDIYMPGPDGLSICRELRQNFRTKSVPIILLTAHGTARDRVEGFRNGADDYITKPFDLQELKVRINGTLTRRRWDLASQPLTSLPGSPAIAEEVNHRLHAGIPFAFAYIDIDQFKAYNDTYGYDAGDKVIRMLATSLVEAAQCQNTGAFPGHVGGDDFVLLGPIESLKLAMNDVARLFDSSRGRFYRREDLHRGHIVSINRQGVSQRFPLMTLSIAVVSTATRRIVHHGQLVAIASELKGYIKRQEHNGRSLVLWDRRRDISEST